jgi:hypothetical protein
MPDDLLPKGLTYFCDSDIRVHEIYWRLSGLYSEIGNEDMAKRLEQRLRSGARNFEFKKVPQTDWDYRVTVYYCWVSTFHSDGNPGEKQDDLPKGGQAGKSSKYKYLLLGRSIILVLPMGRVDCA